MVCKLCKNFRGASVIGFPICFVTLGGGRDSCPSQNSPPMSFYRWSLDTAASSMDMLHKHFKAETTTQHVLSGPLSLPCRQLEIKMACCPVICQWIC